MKNRFIIALILLIIFSSYNIKENQLANHKLNIKKIIIENNKVLEKKKLIKKLSFLYKKNLLFLKSKDIENELNEIDFINTFEFKKIYPDTIKIKISEKKPIVIIQNKTEKKFYTSKGDVINFIELEEFKNLPLVFGDAKNFKNFYDNLQKIDFPLNEIKTFYFFESKRWDLLTKENQLIKLPIKQYNKSLQNFKDIKDKINFEKYKTFDYRINNQLILK